MITKKPVMECNRLRLLIMITPCLHTTRKHIQTQHTHTHTYTHTLGSNYIYERNILIKQSGFLDCTQQSHHGRWLSITVTMVAQ